MAWHKLRRFLEVHDRDRDRSPQLLYEASPEADREDDPVVAASAERRSRFDSFLAAHGIDFHNFNGNPFELARALYQDLEDAEERLRREIRIREDGIAKYGNPGPHAPALDRLRARLDENLNEQGKLHPIVWPSVPLYGTRERSPLTCRESGCITELRDREESSRTGGRCERHWKIATGQARREESERNEPPRNDENVVDYVVGLINGKKL